VRELIPIFWTLTGSITIVAFFHVVAKLAQSPIGLALGRRIQGQLGLGEPELQTEIEALREQVGQLQHQVEEAHERLDFAERLLTQANPGAHLPQER